MFDGNHRSRRPVHMSGSSRNKRRAGGGVGTSSGSSDSRQQLLEETRRRRKERAEQQRREKACRTISRRYRGYRQRCYWACALDQALLKEQTLERFTVLLNERLRLLLWPVQLEKVQQEANNLVARLSPSQQDRAVEMLKLFAQRIRSSEIWEQSHQLPQRTQPAGAGDCTRIVQVALGRILLRLSCSTAMDVASANEEEEEEDSSLVIILRHCLGSGVSSLSFLPMVETLQRLLFLLKKQQPSQPPLHQKNSSFTTTTHVEYAKQQPQRQLAELLWHHCEAAVRSLVEKERQNAAGDANGSVTSAAKALAAVLLLSSPTTSSTGSFALPHFVVVTEDSNDKTNADTLWSSYLEPLVDVLTNATTATTTVAAPTPTTRAYLFLLTQAVREAALRAAVPLAVSALQRSASVVGGEDNNNDNTTSGNGDCNLPLLRLAHTLLFLDSSRNSSNNNNNNNNHQCARIMCLAGFVARGEGDMVRTLGEQTAEAMRIDFDPSAAAKENGDDSEHDDDNDDDKDIPWWRKSKAATTTAADSTTGTVVAAQQPQQRRSSSSLITKRELQTISKLNRLCQHEWSRQRQTVLQQLQNQTQQQQQQRQEAYEEVQLALLLGCPKLWVRWGVELFAPSSFDDNYNNNNTTASSMEASRHSYVYLLGLIFQWAGPSAWKATPTLSSLSLLTQLAFHPVVLPGLWRYFQQKLPVANHSHHDHYSNNDAKKKRNAIYSDPHYVTVLSLFCDLFGHSLLAIRDKAFLERYTNTTANALIGTTVKTSPPLILAEDVIATLRDVLYDLYWTKPVRVTDVLAGFRDHEYASPLQRHVGRDEPTITVAAKTSTLISSISLRAKKDAAAVSQQEHLFPRLSFAGTAGEDYSSSDDDSVQAMDVDNDGNNDSGDQAMDGVVVDPTTSNATAAAADAASEALADVFGDAKMARILTAVPQSVPFERRIRLFDALLRADKAVTQDDSADMQRAMLRMIRRQQANDDDDEDEEFHLGREKIEIHRDTLYEDSMRALQALTSTRLRRKVQVSFINQHGAAEAGIDGGGVFKEFIDDLITTAFSPSEPSSVTSEEKQHKPASTTCDASSSSSSSPSRPTSPLFTATPEHTLQVNPDLFVVSRSDGLLQHYEFMGRVLGKAVYESILVEPLFCLPFLNQLLGKQNSLEDLKLLDKEFHQHLVTLLSMTESDISKLGLTFEITTSITRTVALIPSGSSIAVTKQNVAQYVHLVAHYRLNVQCQLQVKAFLKGFCELIPAPWLRLFAAYELQKIVSGDDSYDAAASSSSSTTTKGKKGIRVEALKAVMQYAAGYHRDHNVIRWFWEVVESMAPHEQGQLLKFITSCSRPPLLGFAALAPAICIQQVRLQDQTQLHEVDDIASKNAPLPTASTCMNLLKLPNYRSKAVLQAKLLAAISANAGFELT